MKELAAFPEVQIFAQDESIAIANIAGAKNPVAILDDVALDKLVVLHRNAMAEAKANPTSTKKHAVLGLCAMIDRVVSPYVLVRNKYFDGPGVVREYDQAQRTIIGLIQQLRDLQGIPEPKPPFCSFCGRGKNDVEKMVEGLVPAYICGDCVGVAAEMLKE